MPKLKFALNHMVAPNLDVDDFLNLATALGIEAIELRNDLGQGQIAGGLSTEVIREKLQRCGLKLISINALQRFNDWNKERQEQAAELINYSKAAGAKALVLVPANDGSTISLDELTQSLNHLGPMLREAGVVGLVEPLGFEKCTLRAKSMALEAIKVSRHSEQFKMVHDTFHHHVAGGGALYAANTGLVHLSGVTDQTVAIGDLLDAHRVLVDDKDTLSNLAQIKALLDGGYDGYFSFEPFASEVHQSSDIAADLKATIAYIENAIV